MNKDEFLEYIRENFTLDGTSQRLVSAIVDCACTKEADDETKWKSLYDMLDPIGVTIEEVKQLQF